MFLTAWRICNKQWDSVQILSMKRLIFGPMNSDQSKEHLMVTLMFPC